MKSNFKLICKAGSYDSYGIATQVLAFKKTWEMDRLKWCTNYLYIQCNCKNKCKLNETRTQRLLRSKYRKLAYNPEWVCEKFRYLFTKYVRAYLQRIFRQPVCYD